MSRLGRAQPVPPIVLVGPFSNTPANFTTPPAALVVENVERRRRYPPLDPFAYASAWAAVTTDMPPGLVVVETPDRRHRYPSLDPFVFGSSSAASGLPAGQFFRLFGP